MIGIINYQAGNLRSVSNALNHINVDNTILENPCNQDKISSLLLPGVGSFYSAMKSIKKQSWDHFIQDHASNGTKVLGICLGMQLLFDLGHEDGITEGLHLLPGTVQAIPPMQGCPVPHVGWNTLSIKRTHPILDDIKDGIDFYHVHSFHCIPDSSDLVLSTTDYGIDIVNAVANKNIVGVQFHPEKSQPSGLKLLKNFARWSH